MSAFEKLFHFQNNLVFLCFLFLNLLIISLWRKASSAYICPLSIFLQPQQTCCCIGVISSRAAPAVVRHPVTDLEVSPESDSGPNDHLVTWASDDVGGYEVSEQSVADASICSRKRTLKIFPRRFLPIDANILGLHKCFSCQAAAKQLRTERVKFRTWISSRFAATCSTSGFWTGTQR